jgi:hypothetical protein
VLVDAEVAMKANKTTTGSAEDETLVGILREAEASSFAEGIDSMNDLEYQDVKKRLLGGEISEDEAVALYLESIRRTGPVVA